MKIHLTARSSGREKTYDVVFTVDGKSLKATCSCPAGKRKQFCKHKWQLLKGNSYWLADEKDDDQYEKLQTVGDLAQKSSALDAIIAMSKAEKRLAEFEKELNTLKKSIAAGLSKGFAI